MGGGGSKKSAKYPIINLESLLHSTRASHYFRSLARPIATFFFLLKRPRQHKRAAHTCVHAWVLCVLCASVAIWLIFLDFIFCIFFLIFFSVGGALDFRRCERTDPQPDGDAELVNELNDVLTKFPDVLREFESYQGSGELIRKVCFCCQHPNNNGQQPPTQFDSHRQRWLPERADGWVC